MNGRINLVFIKTTGISCDKNQTLREREREKEEESETLWGY
jgi:hypothetical protein